ncbi:ATP-dependent DNA helicase PcrA [Candidatus Bathyarchaeota archaeon]|nr:MAG: ATP-dependent DNA helicase PcrA [Candidatus Bathyarchaeota archaeon]
MLDDLNEEQRRAVTVEGGPVLVFAGAGSGKTRVLTYRVAWLVAERGVPPHRILAVTFTNKAADEMRERIEKLVGPRLAREIWVGTFHATATRILRQHADRLGLDRNFVILDEEDQRALIREAMREAEIPESRFSPYAIHYRISRAKDQLIGPGEFSRMAEGEFEEATATVYRIYQRKLEEHNALDFDDLIVKCVELLEKVDDVREYYQERFLHVLVDEFQDINWAQYVMTRLLAGKHRNLFVVGDDDQSVYGWRGADVSIIVKRFREDFPDARVLTLERNYRSTKRILEVANEVIRHNRMRAPKRLWTENPDGDKPVIVEAPNEREEAMFVARQILDMVEREGRRFSDFAVLYRVNAQSRQFEEAFMSHGIPYRVVGGVRFYERKEIKDVVAYLRVVFNPYDTLSLRRIANEPPRGIGDQTMKRLEAYAEKHGWPLFEAMRNARQIPLLGPRSVAAVEAFVKLIEGLRELSGDIPERISLSEFVKEVAERTGYLARLRQEAESGSIDAQARIENVKELFTVAQEFERRHEEVDLASFVSHLSLLSDVDTWDHRANAVTLMTLHSAKGLEFPVVFITGLEEGLLPHRKSLFDEAELEEERRLCYVGITRAKERLFLTYAWQRSFMGSTYRARPSRFLDEIPEELCELATGVELVGVGEFEEFPSGPRGLDLAEVLSETLSEREVGEPEIEEVPEFKVGDRVVHDKFGRGIVVSVERSGDDQILTVAFPEAERKEDRIKKLSAKFAKLRKVE